MIRLTFLTLMGNAVFYLIIAISYCRILTRRFSWPVTVLGFILGFLLYILPTKFMPYADIERGLFVLLSFPVVTIALFRDKWYKSLACAVAAVVVMTVSDLFTVSVLLTPEQVRQGLSFQPLAVQLADYAIYLSTVAFLMFLFTLLMNRYKNRLSGREWALYMLFPVSQYLLIYGWMVLCRLDFSPRRVLVMMVGVAACVGADIALFAAVRGMAQRSELKAKNDLLARQIDLQKEHYAAITAQYENIRRIRHDISSHLYTIQLLLKEGQYAQAAAYSEEVSQASRYRSSLGSCENPVVDAFVYSRTEELRAQGFQVQTQVRVPADPGIRNADMVVAFGNLLDNAAEACQAAGQKQIALSAGMEKGYLHIREHNPAPDTPAAHKRRIPELERGIGLHILQELAETYHGSFTYAVDQGEFEANLFLLGTEET